MTLATTNARLRERAEQLMPGGVSSPVRAFRAVGGEPPFIVSGQGAHVRFREGGGPVSRKTCFQGASGSDGGGAGCPPSDP